MDAKKQAATVKHVWATCEVRMDGVSSYQAYQVAANLQTDHAEWVADKFRSAWPEFQVTVWKTGEVTANKKLLDMMGVSLLPIQLALGLENYTVPQKPRRVGGFGGRKGSQPVTLEQLELADLKMFAKGACYRVMFGWLGNPAIWTRDTKWYTTKAKENSATGVATKTKGISSVAEVLPATLESAMEQRTIIGSFSGWQGFRVIVAADTRIASRFMTAATGLDTLANETEEGSIVLVQPSAVEQGKYFWSVVPFEAADVEVTDDENDDEENDDEENTDDENTDEKTDEEVQPATVSGAELNTIMANGGAPPEHETEEEATPPVAPKTGRTRREKVTA